MWENMIIKEIRQIREKQAEQFNFDLKVIFADLKRQEAESDRVFFLSRQNLRLPFHILKKYLN